MASTGAEGRKGRGVPEILVICREAWDKKYVEVEDEVLFHLILAANFLDIKDLLDLTCKTVRRRFPSKGFSPLHSRCMMGVTACRCMS